MLNFPGVQLTVTDEACTLTSDVPLTTLASAVVGGGFQRTRTILNRYVQRDYNCVDPAGDLRSFAGEESFVGMLTGVQMRHVRAVTLRHEDLTVASIITAGVSNAVAAGVSEPAPLLLSTINIVVLIDASLVQSALVNAVITATEAKTGALMAQAVRTVEGHAATGTSTDAIVIACTGRGAPLPYAGPVTRVGHLIAASVRQCLAQALHLQKEKG